VTRDVIAENLHFLYENAGGMRAVGGRLGDRIGPSITERTVAPNASFAVDEVPLMPPMRNVGTMGERLLSRKNQMSETRLGSRTSAWRRVAIIAMLLVAVALGAGFIGLKLGVRSANDAECCQMPLARSFVVSAKEKLGLVTFHSTMGQDKWISEVVFPGVRNGFFVDVGSGDGTIMSNTKALEQKGWTGICIDPFPMNMQDRTCRIFKEVVFSKAGEPVKFWAHAGGFWGGIVDESFGIKEAKMQKQEGPVVELTTVTLRDILDRANAPRFIHYMSLDIEGGELHALKGFPFDSYRIGALTVEHNFKEPKRSEIKALMESHGYKRVHSSVRDDFYVPQNP
jgi:Methyltransferase FkbM domain